ncbi:Uncharacterised protein [Chryseobacterium nakagawai]|uniref:Uncharacterized protein n=1 Tax=Chryseobacterium nakagawai TaxID=1241982 RepID=A0AAD1DQ96_CHRNA|nr:hypothetical protein [Chryseobacterium nakagawai]AZA91142.1 hypothetical protein EG343_11125 [Chryseobacterium nakagawai]VEH22702.1 Uncharacterised protein [Chryseobacterium nakagawai]
MKLLEELTADIREKLPRLMELEVGCIVEWDNWSGTVLNDGNPLHILWKNSGGIVTYFKDEMSLFSKVIGKDPMLNDVLEFIDNDEVSMYTDGVFSHVLNGLYYDENSEMIKWDLSKPYLKDQSPELIKFLHGLIKK